MADVGAVAEAGSDLESSAVATHIELLRQLEGIDGAKTVASILVVEARSSTVLADLAGAAPTSTPCSSTTPNPWP